MRMKDRAALKRSPSKRNNAMLKLTAWDNTQCREGDD